MYQLCDSHRHRVAFVIGLIILFADKALLCSGNLFLGCFAAAGKQLIDSGWSDFFVDCAAFLPRCQISDAYHFEQRLRLVRKSRETLFPHEYVNPGRLFAEQLVNGGENFAMGGLAASRVQVAQALDSDDAVLISLNGKARTAQRQIGRQNSQ